MTSITDQAKKRILEELKKIRMLPHKTAEDNLFLENKFRTYLLNHFHIQEKETTYECGLAAIVKTLHPEVTPLGMKTVSLIVRQDLIRFLQSHPDIFSEYMVFSESIDLKEIKQELNHYCSRLASLEQPIGKTEFQFLSHLLQTPIHIYSYRSFHCFGNHFENESISLYYNPLESFYYPIILKSDRSAA